MAAQKSEPRPLPEWLVVGAPAVELTPSRQGFGPARIVRSVVKSIGVRDIVLENGHRYGRRLVRSNGTWAPSTTLCAPESTEVCDALAHNRTLRLTSEVDRAYEGFRRTRSTDDAAALLEAAKAWLDAMG